MKALSIRQPWAWLIIHGGKDIENRTWSTKYRGRILVHASQGMSRPEYEAAKIVADTNSAYLPDFENLKRGGIIGSVEIVDCVDQSTSPWFFGPHGFVLRDPQPLPFIPIKGMLGFFNSSLPTVVSCSRPGAEDGASCPHPERACESYGDAIMGCVL